jgi:uncharacterized membrane protein YvbJ
MKCLECGAENLESNRYCDSCGHALSSKSEFAENLTDGRYGPADPENPDYPDEDEGIYVVWKWPYNLWGISMQTRSSYMLQSVLVWVFYFFIMLGLILKFGLTALVVVLILTTFLGIMQYISWKAGRSAAEEFNRIK